MIGTRLTSESTCLKGAHKFWLSCFNTAPFQIRKDACFRLKIKYYPVRLECLITLAVSPVLLVCAILAITQQWVSGRRELSANLVCTSREQLALKQRKTVMRLQSPVYRRGTPSIR